jgi:glutathione synthase/RimK-type ligase-like ATP-grasp enzyme
LGRAEYKLFQLQTAARLDIPFPKTIVTNDPGSISAATWKIGVVKPVRYGLLAVDPDPLVAYTQVVSGDDLEGLGGSPVIAQERVLAAYHLRVTTVQNDVFVAGLEADDEVDWRRDIENHRRFRRHNLPKFDSLPGSARILAERLGLRYSAQDWMVSDSGECVFVEANPNGQWLFVDELWQGGISESIAQVLLKMRDD